MLNAVRLRIDLAYDGTGFYGWAKQPDMRTVQGEIERVLHTVLRVPEGDDDEPLRLTVAGRTDTGVHASHQVCHLDINEETLARCVAENLSTSAFRHTIILSPGFRSATFSGNRRCTYSPELHPRANVTGAYLRRPA